MLKNLNKSSLIAATALGALVSLAEPGAFAHGDAKPDHAKSAKAAAVEEHAFGQQGDPKKVSRPIAVDTTNSGYIARRT